MLNFLNDSLEVKNVINGLMIKPESTYPLAQSCLSSSFFESFMWTTVMYNLENVCPTMIVL